MLAAESGMRTKTGAFPAPSFWERITIRLGAGATIVAVLLAAWEIAARVLRIRPSALPSPTRLLLELWREAPRLAEHAWITGSAALEGLILAASAAFLLASLAHISTSWRRLARPLISLAGTLPVIALAPLAALWFGYGRSPAIALSFIVCFLSVLPDLQAGMDSLPREVADFFSSIGASPGQIFWKARAPACLPFLMRALKAAVPLALAGAAVAELISADAGLGHLMISASARADSLPLFAALAVLCLMALAGCLVLLIVEEIWIRWPAMPGGDLDGTDAGL
jgi:NitT/TauT family transport system permease protein